MNLLKVTVCCAMLSTILASSSLGDIVTPVAVVPSSEFVTAVNMINGSGLSGVGPVEDQLHNNDENAMWQTFNLDTGTSIGETAEFILDNNYDLSSAIIWQYNGLNGFGLPELDREIDEFELSVSPDLVSGFTSLGTFNLAPAMDQMASGFNEPAQTFVLSGADNVRRVLLTIRSVQGGVDDGTAGLSEVRFDGTLVPEPAACLLLTLAGLSLMWIARGRR